METQDVLYVMYRGTCIEKLQKLSNYSDFSFSRSLCAKLTCVANSRSDTSCAVPILCRVTDKMGNCDRNAKIK